MCAGDGVIDYEEFVPVCYSILLNRFTQQAATSTILASEDALTQHVAQKFRDMDTDSARTVPFFTNTRWGHEDE
jgi:hypothetical protein